jgi:hypothetical protein
MLIKRKSLGDTTNNGVNSSSRLLNNTNNTTSVKKFVPVKRILPGSSGNTIGACSTTSSSQSAALVTPTIPKSRFVQRVSIFGGTSNSNESSAAAIGQKKFQRPMIKRRAYGKQADVALQQCTLGQKRRFNSMDKILARAGRPLTYKLPNSNNNTNTTNNDSDSGSDEDDDEKEKDRPFEPLELWKSPHLEGGVQKGLPSQTYVRTFCSLNDCNSFDLSSQLCETLTQPHFCNMFLVFVLGIVEKFERIVSRRRERTNLVLRKRLQY